MSEREELAWFVGYNLAICFAIVVITLGGLWLSGEWDGLWSLLLILLSGVRFSGSRDSD